MWASFFPMFLFCVLHAAGKFHRRGNAAMRMLSVTWTRMICHGILDIDVLQRGTQLLTPKGNTSLTWLRRARIRSFCSFAGCHEIFAMLSLRSIGDGP